MHYFCIFLSCPLPYVFTLASSPYCQIPSDDKHYFEYHKHLGASRRCVIPVVCE